MSLNRRDLLRLKSVARIVLEERSVVKMKNKAQSDVISSKNPSQLVIDEDEMELTMEILPQVNDEMLFDGDMDVVDMNGEG